MARTATIDKPTQLNVRIGSELKASGEAAFAAAGVTSSEAIRRLFEVAERHHTDPDYLRAFLQDEDAPTSVSDSEHLRSLLRQALVIAEKGAS